MNQYQIQIASENALIVYFSEPDSVAISSDISAKVQQVKTGLEQYMGNELLELIPSYSSLLVVFDPFKTDQYAIRQLLKQQMARFDSSFSTKSNLVELPVYYGVEVGLDLQQMTTSLSLSIEEIIELHQQTEYRVYAIGFAPGFAYLGEVDERIACSRLATPRNAVPKGAVGIADQQTAIYPASSPGGWNIIGNCPVDMFNPSSKQTMPIQVGDLVRFKAISKDEYLTLGGVL